MTTRIEETFSFPAHPISERAPWRTTEWTASAFSGPRLSSTSGSDRVSANRLVGSSIMKSWSLLQNYMELLRAPLEWRSSKQKMILKGIPFSLISDLFHVFECEIDHGDGALLSHHIHCHHRRLHGCLGWLLCLYDLWGDLYDICMIFEVTEVSSVWSLRWLFV